MKSMISGVKDPLQFSWRKSHTYIIEGLLRELTFMVFIPDSQSKESRKSKERQ